MHTGKLQQCYCRNTKMSCLRIFSRVTYNNNNNNNNDNNNAGEIVRAGFVRNRLVGRDDDGPIRKRQKKIYIYKIGRKKTNGLSNDDNNIIIYNILYYVLLLNNKYSHMVNGGGITKYRERRLQLYML
jgi:hypothetical protein